MTLKKFVLIPVIIGVLACLIQALDQLLYTSVPPEGNVGFSWISFQSWAVYFLAGCTVRGGIKAFIAYAIGIAASIVIMVLGGAMTPALIKANYCYKRCMTIWVAGEEKCYSASSLTFFS